MRNLCCLRLIGAVSGVRGGDDSALVVLIVQGRDADARWARRDCCIVSCGDYFVVSGVSPTAQTKSVFFRVINSLQMQFLPMDRAAGKTPKLPWFRRSCHITISQYMQALPCRLSVPPQP